MNTVIGRSPPADGRDWECQCARCGSSLDFERCDHCGGDGFDGHDCGEDSCCCMHPEENVVCDICDGKGSWPRCASTPEFYQNNPLLGRSTIEPSTPEWFCVEGST